MNDKKQGGARKNPLTGRYEGNHYLQQGIKKLIQKKHSVIP
jgi:hypothetical protein